MINLLDHQLAVIDQISSGSILCGGVGSGKSITSIYFYQHKICDDMKIKKDLYIITTAAKRDSLEWEAELCHFLLSTNRDVCYFDVKVVVDSWNNIVKYKDINDAFFIFDEQKICGSGTWVKTFLKIAKNNLWILLSATPGDRWIDYIPVFIANNFYKNRTEFIMRHIVYKPFSKYPTIDKYIDCERLSKLRDKILVIMNYEKKTIQHHIYKIADYDETLFNYVVEKRWNVYKDKPIKTVSEFYHLMRKIVNSDPSRVEIVKEILKDHKKIIIFYNFHYELEILRNLCIELNIPYSEWNGLRHEKIPDDDNWIYLVQYTSGAEGWNCILTNCIVFYSQNYSYRITHQSGGRIDRLNTPFKELYYYYIRSKSFIDMAIYKALKNKKKFKEDGEVLGSSQEKHSI
jgi:hypothetical protein